MSSSRPRLVVPAGFLPVDATQVDSLRSAFEIVEVESFDDARRAAAEGSGGLMALPPSMYEEDPGDEGLPVAGVRAILEQIGEGVGVVDDTGAIRWFNARLRDYDEPVRERLIDTCRRALEQFNQADEASVPVNARPARKFGFAVDEAHFEVMVTIADVDETDRHRVRSVVGVLWAVTASRQLQKKLDAIDAAGSEVLRIESAAVAKLNLSERLKLLEEKISRSVHELLDFDHYEIRLIDRETNQLELVMSEGLTPLKIGEVIYAATEENGISGYVAATGLSYLCHDISRDPRYREGLEDAASSLTVPLRLHDEVIGVFNVESNTVGAFDEEDREFAELFGRYVAMAMHILDLLVIERYTTNAQIAENILGELEDPLASIDHETAQLRAMLDDPAQRDILDQIITSAGTIRERLLRCARGPQTILGAEREMHRPERDPRMGGKRVIVADNEEVTRDAISELLANRGCDVTKCAGGTETIAKLRAASAEHTRFDLVISDIRMPDCNGYDVFRTVKEVSADTPVILITGFGYDPHHSIVRASQEGLHSFLFKPLKASQLLEAVTKAFGGDGEVG